ncbi:Ubiquitin-conjugating enzyme E2 [Penicillium taxi]|uniref:Ubiquitin-conjugating enzyme E2 n=1 Tax=Penicillium taxi TaxID=168475 RepID=UPI002545A3B9|nr:Ubiquitin-conjugating enzyme E2 [Penicillium taxi]KAJ5902190.1 Ubiquitin-conjugating enzyme E2 [Penicillium taxi]
MISNSRRLAADHAALQSSKLPPYYLWPEDNNHFDIAGDLSQLTVLLTGPPGTPYSQGLWRLQLEIPHDYPHSPPKATFCTRIWHPNMEEITGAVCVDTLKRDWQSNLTLRDVLITISCLLIQPTPDSSLNSSAGAFFQENFDAFAQQARLMTSIHAPIPHHLSEAVKEASIRCEDPTPKAYQMDRDPHNQRPRKLQRIQTGSSKRSSRYPTPFEDLPHAPRDIRTAFTTPSLMSEDEHMTDSDIENSASASKENNPSFFSPPPRITPLSPRKNAHGKRPLSILAIPYPEELEEDIMLIDSESDSESAPKTASERNISANINNIKASNPCACISPMRKPRKLALGRSTITPRRHREELQIYEDAPDRMNYDLPQQLSAAGKENRDSGIRALNRKDDRGPQAVKTANGLNVPAGQMQNVTMKSISSQASQLSSKVPKVFSTLRMGALPKPRPKPRIGVRRL